jgi:glutamyl-tRNA synthetase
MEWLGLDWDGDAWFQSHFAERHAEVAHQLVERGHAYRCWMTTEELAAAREEAHRSRARFLVRSPWRDREDGPTDQPYVVRLKAPREGEARIDDRVQGPVTVQNEEIDDFILLRSDGTPTYMLAVVVDDHDMGVTHVVRGDDHLNNAFRQLAIIRAMGWPEPDYGHVPLIHGQDGAKLSKRHGALGVETYRDELGILPEALFNYLLRLGWGHGDDEIIAGRCGRWFDLGHVGRSPSRFDMKKLENLNGHYLREADDRRLAVLSTTDRGRARARSRCRGCRSARRAMEHLKPRAKDLNELAEGALFLFAPRPLKMDDKAEALLQGEARDLLALVHQALSGLEGWSAEATEQAVREVAEAKGVKLGQVAQPLRAALTGRATSPGIFDVLVLLGRDESLARIADQMTGKGS